MKKHVKDNKNRSDAFFVCWMVEFFRLVKQKKISEKKL